MSKLMKRTVIVATVAAAVAVLYLCYAVFDWTVNRIYVTEGHSLLLRYKGPILFGSSKPAKQGMWAEEGEVGILRELRGTGRHFYCPLWWERTIVDDVEIKSGEVGLVTCKLGDSLPEGQFLVDGEIGKTTKKGVLRKVLGPGRYRINPYGYDVQVIQEIKTTGTDKISGWVNIPTGYVGVVTNLTDNPSTKAVRGIQDHILQPGLYPINPKEQQIDVVEVGYRETTIKIHGEKAMDEVAKSEQSNELTDFNFTGGISFPSNDGFKIVIDFTAVWGLHPDQAAKAIRDFGNVGLVESKVIIPQIESISRNNGSEYSAVQLLVGKEREEFQNKLLGEFHEVLKTKHIGLLYGLVRHIYIPKEVRQPIQLSFISDELKLTREQEKKTAKAEADLKEAERMVEFETTKVKAETKKLVAEKIADGDKVVAETDADTKKLAAAIEKDSAEFESQANVILKTAESNGKKMIEEAKANRFKLGVDAFGNPAAYNNWVFATGLPEDIDLKLFYAGTGTLWTDLKDALRVMVDPNQKADAVKPNK